MGTHLSPPPFTGIRTAYHHARLPPHLGTGDCMGLYACQVSVLPLSYISSECLALQSRSSWGLNSGPNACQTSTFIDIYFYLCSPLPAPAQDLRSLHPFRELLFFSNTFLLSLLHAVSTTITHSDCCVCCITTGPETRELCIETHDTTTPVQVRYVTATRMLTKLSVSFAFKRYNM